MHEVFHTHISIIIIKMFFILRIQVIYICFSSKFI
nr:MAG TPA: hypothetical protein [Caudoviricetes sp.]